MAALKKRGPIKTDMYILPHVAWKRLLEGECLSDGSIWHAAIPDSGKASIMAIHSGVLIRCFIDPSHLRAIAHDHHATAGEILRDQFLPDNPAIMVGDFGEILAWALLQEWGDQPCFPLLRWRLKSHKNATVTGPDLLGYLMATPPIPSSQDVLLIAEVKTRSSAANPQVALESFEGVSKHYVTRLANSLFYTQAWLRSQGLLEEATRFARFTNPHRSDFIRRLVPCVVHEEATWSEDFLRELPVSHQFKEQVVFLLVTVLELRTWIETVYAEAVTQANAFTD